MAPKRSYTTYLCLSLDAFPCILSFITIFIWVFFTSAPASSATAKCLWLLPMALASIFSIAFLIRQDEVQESERKSWYQISNFEQATLDIIRSLACSAVVFLIAADGGWTVIRELSSKMEPKGSPDASDNALGWLIIPLIALVIIAVLYWLGYSLLNTVHKDWKRLRDVRKELKPRGPPEEGDAEAVELEEWK